MPILLDTYKQTLVQSVLALLWRQWSLLGVPGHEAKESNSSPFPSLGYIIDPEALLLATSEIGRYDARLFDQSLHWLQEYGRLINIQRLKTLSQTACLGNTKTLAAMATIISKNSRLSKWKVLQTPVSAPASVTPSLTSHQHQLQPQPLFLSSHPTGSRSPDTMQPPPQLRGTEDPHFLRYGYIRAPYHLRKDATAPQVTKNPELLLIKLRALFGVNARAEIIAALLSSPGATAHPSGLAAQTGYLARSLQDTLNEMALSGHVFTSRPKNAREKYFTLRPCDWNFLLTWSTPQFPPWTNWVTLYALFQDTITTLHSEPFEKASPLMAALHCRKIYDRHLPALNDAGMSRYFIGTSAAIGGEFVSSFLEDISKIAAFSIEPKESPMNKL